MQSSLLSHQLLPRAHPPVQLPIPLDLPTPAALVIPRVLGLGDAEILSRDRRTEYLRSEETALRPLNHLLVDTLGWVVHEHRASFVVDLSIDASISDEVDDPLLAFLVAKAETCGEIPVEASAICERSERGGDWEVCSLDVDALVNLAVAFRDQMPRGIQERLGSRDEEEVVLENLIRLT